MNRVLVTGASGFIGRHLVAMLHDRNCAIRALVRSPLQGLLLPQEVELRLGDLAEPATLTGVAEGVDTIVHLGGATAGPWQVHEQATVRGTAALLTEAQRAGVRRFIYISSLAVYDLAQVSGQPALTEDAPLLRPRPGAGAYARGKVLAERLVHRAARRGLDITIVRPGLVYGAQRRDLPHLGHKLPGGRHRIAIGSPDLRLPLISVHSLCESILAILESSATMGKTYHVVDDTQISRRRYIQAISAMGHYLGRTTYVPLSPMARFADALALFGKLPGLRGRLPQTAGEKIRNRARSVQYDTTRLQKDSTWRPATDVQTQLHYTGPSKPASKDRPWRVGIIGAGLNSHFHLRVLANLDRVQIVGILDLRPGAADELAGKFGTQGFTDAAQFHEQAKPEVVHVITPPGTHAAITLDALNRGMHVFCEKPLAMTVDECRAMMDLACEKRLQLGVNHNLLTDARFEQARRIIRSGKLGRVVHVRTTAAFIPPRLTGSSRQWLIALPGAALEDLAPHVLYTTLALSPEPLKLASVNHPDCFASNRELHITLTGSYASASVLLSLRARPNQFTMEILGTRSRLHIDLLNMQLHHLRLGKGPKAVARAMMIGKHAVGQITQTAARVVGLAIGHTHPYGDMTQSIRRFYTSLDRCTPCDIAPHHGLQTVQLIRQIWPTPTDKTPSNPEAHG